MVKMQSVEKMTLKMWTSKPMPEAVIGKDGKMEKDENGKIKNTGNTLDYTEYYFVDLMGNLLKILTKNSKFRDLEGQEGTLYIKLEVKEFGGKTEKRFQLEDFVV